MSLRVENNNKFIRGKGKVREKIEQYLKSNYKLDEHNLKAEEYIFYVPYTTINDLEKTVYDIIQELSNEADLRNCFIEVDARCDELELMW